MIDWRDPGPGGGFYTLPPPSRIIERVAPAPGRENVCPPGQVFGTPPCPPGMACTQVLRCYTPRNGGGGGNGGTPAVDPFARLGDVLAGFGRGGGITIPQPRQSTSTVAFVPSRTSQFNTAALVFLIIAAGAGGYWYYTKRARAA